MVNTIDFSRSGKQLEEKSTIILVGYLKADSEFEYHKDMHDRSVFIGPVGL